MNVAELVPLEVSDRHIAVEAGTKLLPILQSRSFDEKHDHVVQAHDPKGDARGQEDARVDEVVDAVAQFDSTRGLAKTDHVHYQVDQVDDGKGPAGDLDGIVEVIMILIFQLLDQI